MFLTDSQTQRDLGFLDSTQRVSELYKYVHTQGGSKILDEWLHNPLNDSSLLKKKIGIVKFFQEYSIKFPFELASFDTIEEYLSDRDERTRLVDSKQSFSEKISGLIASDTQQKKILKGIHSLIVLLQAIPVFISSQVIVQNTFYTDQRKDIKNILSNPELDNLLHINTKDKWPQERYAAYDTVLRFRQFRQIQKLLQYVYTLDAYLSLVTAAETNKFCFPEILENSDEILQLMDVKHPLLKNAKSNDVTFDIATNVLFLTGANMAGKSTFMKSIGMAIYLAHCGFPVAAKSLRFRVFDGMFSTINLPDNLGIGASHFYAEVLRVKKIAQELHAGKKLFVLFDELFRGTNVKDAGDATVLVTEGFTLKSDSLFIISTHIIEAAEVLRLKTSSIQYKNLPTVMTGNKPTYTYQLREGVTEDRHGMLIIRNEGIIEMLENNVHNNSQSPQ